MRVIWTPEAQARLRSIEAYIAHDSPRTARTVVARLLRRSRTLATPPLAGRRVPEYRGEDASLREVLERPFRIIYRVVDAERIDIIAVWHYRQVLPLDPKRIQNAPSG